MDKKWISQLADDIERKYGKDVRDKMFGDVNNVKNDYESVSVWFSNFIRAC